MWYDPDNAIFRAWLRRLLAANQLTTTSTWKEADMKIALPTPACFERTGLFIPDEETRDTDRLGMDIAQTMCAACPFRVECATQGLRWGDTHSIRAGVPTWREYATQWLGSIIEAETP